MKVESIKLIEAYEVVISGKTYYRISSNEWRDSNGSLVFLDKLFEKAFQDSLKGTKND